MLIYDGRRDITTNSSPSELPRYPSQGLKKNMAVMAVFTLGRQPNDSYSCAVIPSMCTLNIHSLVVIAEPEKRSEQSFRFIAPASEGLDLTQFPNIFDEAGKVEFDGNAFEYEEFHE